MAIRPATGPCGRRSRPICRFRAARLVNRGRSSSRRAIGQSGIAGARAAGARRSGLGGRTGFRAALRGSGASRLPSRAGAGRWRRSDCGGRTPAAPGARMALVTPSHQAPLGVSMSLARRAELLAGRRAGAWVVEDDYDGEYHYAGPPLPALRAWMHMTASSTRAVSRRCFTPGWRWPTWWRPRRWSRPAGRRPRPGPTVAPSWSRPSSPISWPKGIFPSSQEDAPVVRPASASAGGALRQVFGDGAEIGWRRAACTSSSGCRNMATTPRRRDAPGGGPERPAPVGALCRGSDAAGTVAGIHESGLRG